MLTIIPHNEVPLRGFKWAFSWARRAEDVAPYQGCVVGADVLGGPRARGVSRTFSWARRAEDVAPYQGAW